MLLLLLPALAADPYHVPDQAWPGLAGALVSPTMGASKQNQQAVVDGWLFAGGNGVHELWDIGTPGRPTLLSTLTSPHRDGEAESHSLAFALVDDRRLAATISGLGVDLWDVTDPTAPGLLAAVELEGVRYGDNSEAVWGVSWQGRWLFVGGTSTGLHVVDTLDPAAPEVVARLSQVELGGVSAGPLWALGDVLVVTTPQGARGRRHRRRLRPARAGAAGRGAAPGQELHRRLLRHARLPAHAAAGLRRVDRPHRPPADGQRGDPRVGVPQLRRRAGVHRLAAPGAGRSDLQPRRRRRGGRWSPPSRAAPTIAWRAGSPTISSRCPSAT
jgi:hypothetical protein